MTDLVYITLHVASIVAALLAGFLWMRSAYIEVPDIAPYMVLGAEETHSRHETMREITASLESHRQALKRQTTFNKAAARAASAAAVSQAATFALNLLAVLAKAAI